jgi:hypothetical protein
MVCTLKSAFLMLMVNGVNGRRGQGVPPHAVKARNLERVSVSARWVTEERALTPATYNTNCVKMKSVHLKVSAEFHYSDNISECLDTWTPGLYA